MTLEGHVDVDWASSLDDRKSTIGYCIYLGGNLVVWNSKKQKVIPRSRTESEYRALTQAATEFVWLQSLFSELGIEINGCHTLWCDNIGAKQLASNLVFHSRTKDIETNFHLMREKVIAKQLEMKYVPTEDQLLIS